MSTQQYDPPVDGVMEAGTDVRPSPPGGDPGYIQGTVEAQPDLTVRSGPGTDYPSLGYSVPYGALIYIACYNTGATVSATWPDGSTFNTNVWDGLWDGSVGGFNGAYVSDAWVNTGGDTATMVPHC